mmetsp:Transcript_31259/g.82015  ORF Transcript_31259/g.82015 Transcript_31259/m.82015 type:complete len:80 (+) Transcript_31259:416-655(+)
MHAMKTGQLLIQKIEVQQFSDIVKNISNAVGSEANKIEKEKMRVGRPCCFSLNLSLTFLSRPLVFETKLIPSRKIGRKG